MAQSVCAVIPERGAALDGAVATQAPTVVRDDGVLGRGLERALEGDAEWIWLLDGSALPAPEALSRLLAALERTAPLPEPVLLVSKVTAADGSLVERQAPWPRRGATEHAMLAAPRHLLPVRASRAGSLLVAREAARRHGPPLAGLGPQAAALEWTGRLLRDGAGFLVTDSVAVARDATPAAGDRLSDDPYEDLQAGLAMVRGPGWHAKEKLWLAADVGQRTLVSLAGRRVSPLGLAKAGARGWRTHG